MISSAQKMKPLAILMAILHASVGFAMNSFFPLYLFLGTGAYLGSFFGFMALIYQGPVVGLLVLAATACGAAFRGDFGYFAAACVEALAAAAYHARGRRNIGFAAAAFWAVLGIWIVVAARLLEGYPFPEAVLSGSTVAVFAVFSATIASLLADYARRLPSNDKFSMSLGLRGDVPFRRIVFETSCALAMVPFLAFMVMTSGTRTKGLEMEIGKRLDSLTESYYRIAPLWREVKRTRLESIARSVSSGMDDEALGEMLGTFMATGTDVVSIGVLGPDGRIAAVAADGERRPNDRSGAELSSTDAFAEAASTGSLALSVEADAEGRPLVCIVLPFGDGEGRGAAFSLDDASTMSALIDGIAGPTRCRGWLLDPLGGIVATNAAEEPSPARAADFRSAIRVEHGQRPRLGGSSRALARSSFAQYVAGGIYPGWTAVFVVDMGPLRVPVIAFALSLALFALAAVAIIVLASAYASKIVVSSLERLGRATRGFKERFLDREAEPLAESADPGIDWPEEGVQEVVVLSRAFQDAGELLDRRYRETLAALGEAERASRAKRDLLSAVGHDIRGPMAGIVGVAERLEAELGEGRAAVDARLIKETGAQLGAFVEELLDRSALEDGRLELRSEKFDLRALFDGAVSVFHAAAIRKGLSLEYSFDERLPACVVGDRARLFQVLGNLIGNAVKYTSAGSVKVSASLAAAAEGRATVLFEVSDTGLGIPPEDSLRIFDPYYRADEGRSGAEKGSGLGLSLARGLVRLMGSDIAVESSVGKGSRFSFAVSLAADETYSCGDAEGAQAAGAPPIGARVLLVDDIDIGRRHSRRILELAGCEVEEAADGGAAVEAALGSDFDLILMDMELPTLDGRAAARAILSGLGERGTASLPLVIALTAYSAEGDEESIIASGFDGYIVKTGDSGPMLAAARRAAARRASPNGAATESASKAPSSGEAAPAAEPGPEKDIDFDGLLDAYMGNREFLVALLRAFVSDGSMRVGELRRCIAEGDSAGLAKALHSLVNIAGSGRAEIALRRARAWEAALRAGLTVGDAAERAALEAAERAIEAAAAYLDGLEAGISR